MPTIQMNIEGLKNLAVVAKQKDKLEEMLDIVLEWAESADKEICRLQKQLEEAN